MGLAKRAAASRGRRGGSKFTGVFQSYLNDIQKDIDRSSRERLKVASAHVARKMRAKVGKLGVSSPGNPPGRRSGDLRKGIKSQVFTDTMTAVVGVKKPAYHAHLLEFGHRQVTKDGRVIGHVAPRPFVGPTFEEELDEVKRILRTGWVV